MPELKEEIRDIYGKKLRVRVCGICIQEDKILLVRHDHLGKTGTLWAPPGGGMEYGEDAKSALKREFLEETGLNIEIEDFLFVHEYLDTPLHGIELFFFVKIISGKLELGTDPEMSKSRQILSKVGFYALSEIEKSNLHYTLQSINSLEEFINLKGYFKFH